MSIPFKRYINITSGVGAGAGVRLRDLITRCFSDNELIPPGAQIEFTDANSVGTYFGAASEEYKRAAYYFGFISKNVTKANKISFARWVDVAVAPKVWGNTAAKALATFTAVAAGSLNLTMGANQNALININLTAAASLAAVATALQVAIRAAAGPQFAAAVVTFDATTNRFNLVGSVTGAAAMAVGVSGVGVDLAPLLGWTAASGAIINAGSGIETLTACLTNSATLSNNFASFLFQPVLSQAQVLEVGVWEDAQNNMFMYLERCDATSAAALSAALIGLSGVCLTLSLLPGVEFPGMLPGMILAATDYTRRGSAQNYMYQQSNLTPAVLDGPTADTYDNLRVNYYGQTQTGGQQISFYQRGVLMGGSSAATDMNTYANELWLKDAAAAALMRLLLSVGRVSANKTGRAQLIAVLSGPDVIGRALFNGTISVGKPLDVTAQLYIANQTGDPLAWLQVQNQGYWLDAQLQSYVTTDSRTEWKIVYAIIYSKDDVVRKVEGSDILI